MVCAVLSDSSTCSQTTTERGGAGTVDPGGQESEAPRETGGCLGGERSEHAPEGHEDFPGEGGATENTLGRGKTPQEETLHQGAETVLREIFKETESTHTLRGESAGLSPALLTLPDLSPSRRQHEVGGRGQAVLPLPPP